MSPSHSRGEYKENMSWIGFFNAGHLRHKTLPSLAADWRTYFSIEGPENILRSGDDIVRHTLDSDLSSWDHIIAKIHNR